MGAEINLNLRREDRSHARLCNRARDVREARGLARPHQGRGPRSSSMPSRQSWVEMKTSYVGHQQGPPGSRKRPRVDKSEAGLENQKTW